MRYYLLQGVSARLGELDSGNSRIPTGGEHSLKPDFVVNDPLDGDGRGGVHAADSGGDDTGRSS